MSQLLDNETEQALEAAAEASAKAAKKGRNINHAAKCRKAWDAFQAAAKDAMSAGVSVTLALEGDSGGIATAYTASITATY